MESFLGITESEHIFITGAAGGIGVATAEAFLTYTPCKVSLHFNSTSNSLQQLLEKYPKRTVAVSADCRDEKSVEKAILEAKEKLGPITTLIANHAIFTSEDVSICDMSLNQWKNTLDVNLTGVFLFTREFLRQLKSYASTLTKEQLYDLNANVVLIGSTAGEFGEANHADYASTKSALMFGFMRSLKNEIVKICPRGRCNSVAPGWTLTPMAEESVKRGEHYKALQTTPLKKIANVSEVANTIVSIVSKKVSGHTNGNNVFVHGGMEGRVLNSIDDLKKS